MKSNKSYSKRIKLTRQGKLVARKPGQCHFNARDTAKQKLVKRREVLLNMSPKAKQRFLSNM